MENFSFFFIQDIHVIYSFLRQLDSFSRLADQPLRAICRNARYERHRANEILFRSVCVSHIEPIKNLFFF